MNLQIIYRLNLKRTLLTTFTLLAMTVTVMAQDIHFSQFYLSPMNLNPALTGVMNYNSRVTINYRNQWSSILKSNAFSTYSMGYERKSAVGRNDYFGFGGTLWGDRAGEADFTIVQGKVALSYAKHMGGGRKTPSYLVVGVEAGITQESIDFTKLRWGNQHDGEGGFDSSLPSNETFGVDNIIYPDFNAGLLWFSVLSEKANVYAGAAYSHLNEAEISFLENADNSSIEGRQLFPKYTIHAGGEVMFNDKMGITPGLVTFFQGPHFELNTGASLKYILTKGRDNYQAFSAGIWVRMANRLDEGTHMDAAIAALRFDYNNITLGFSYDVNTSELKAASNSNGGFELALQYNVAGSDKRGVYCPHF